jgi:hypothetical protein
MSMTEWLKNELEEAKGYEEICRRTLSKLAMVSHPDVITRFANDAIDAIKYTNTVKTRLNDEKGED